MLFGESSDPHRVSFPASSVSTGDSIFPSVAGYGRIKDMPKWKVTLAQFPENRGNTFLAPCTWIGKLMAQLETHPDCHGVDLWAKEGGDTPITMLRNLCLVQAEQNGSDYVLMIDSDNKPDLYLGADPLAKPFFWSSLEFMQQHHGPCVVAAPYCGGPPDEGVHCFRWVNMTSKDANPDFAMKTITRHEASQMRGMFKAAAAATGVILIDMRAVKKLRHPRFYYEWKDETESVKASTEDVVFTRNLNYEGVPVYVNFDAWAGHIKPKMVGKPIPVHGVSVTRQLRKHAQDMALGLVEELPTQEPPIRVFDRNSFKELPPTFQKPELLPGNLDLRLANDEKAIEQWKAMMKASEEDDDFDAAQAMRDSIHLQEQTGREKTVQTVKEVNGEVESEEHSGDNGRVEPIHRKG